MTTERYATLDVLRGVAVMGILLMNIAAFAMPPAAYSNPLAYGARGPGDIWAWAVAFVLIDGKMRALFSFLFGASTLLVVERAEAAGRDGAAVHFARMVTLLGFGIAHFALLWWGDILHHYALIGMVAYAFTRMSTTRLVIFGIAGFALSTTIFAMLAVNIWAIRHDAGLPHATAEIIATWRSVADAFGVPEPLTTAREIALYRGSYEAILLDRIRHDSGDAVRNLLVLGPQTLSLMILGMAGLRSGFLTGGWPRARYRRWAVTLYAIGLPPMVALAWWTWVEGFEAFTVFLTAFPLSAPFCFVLMAAHASAIMWAIDGRRGPIIALIAAAGKMAFSNYLGTTLLMTALFYGYGLGWFGTFSRAQLFLVPPAVWAVMLLWSKPWLDRFAYGPLEWMWRSLAQLRFQPMQILVANGSHSH